MNLNTKFVIQTLSPLNGEIKRPTTWEYRENHENNCCRWIIAEKILEHGYETGVQIELVINYSQHANQKPSECALNFIALKKSQVSTIHREYSETSQGIFTRNGLEFDEGKYRMIYSFFWSDESDILTTVVMGARKQEWDNYEHIFEVMSDVKPFDI